MILGIDIGNTTVKFGFIKNLENIKVYRLYSNKTKTCDDWILDIKNLLSLENKDIDDIMIVSVVQEVEKRITEAVEKVIKKPVVVEKDIKVPIKSNYRSVVGTDRIVNAFAALKLTGSPAIVASFGTALTVDVINKRKEFEGGIIFPGISTGLKALAEFTSQLPYVTLDKSPPLIGKHTEECILSGATWGYKFLIENYTKSVESIYKYPFKLVLTGGDVNLVSRFLDRQHKVEEYLSMKGLYLLYKQYL